MTAETLMKGVITAACISALALGGVKAWTLYHPDTSRADHRAALCADASEYGSQISAASQKALRDLCKEQD